MQIYNRGGLASVIAAPTGSCPSLPIIRTRAGTRKQGVRFRGAWSLVSPAP